MQSSASDERDLLAYTGATPAAAARPGSPRRKRHAGRRLIRYVVNGAIVGAAILALFGPAVVFLVAMSWGVITYARSIVLLVDLVHARNFGALGPQLHQLNLAARFMLLSAGYFALVFSLIVVYVGVLGRRRRRALLIPGVGLVVPSIIAYLLGAVLSGAAVSDGLGLPLWALAAFFLYVLFDTIALGALLADTRAPARRVRRFIRPRRYFLWQRMPYYSRRLQSRYAVFREALRETEEPARPLAPLAAAQQIVALPPNEAAAPPIAAAQDSTREPTEPATDLTTVA